MKKCLFLLLLFVCSFTNNAFSQTKTLPNSYTITKLEDLSKLKFYKTSIENVDFEKYRAKTKNVVLEFRNGFSLELVSAEKLAQSVGSVNLSNYTDDLPSGYRYPLFKVDDSGIVVTMHKTKITKLELANSKN